MTYKICNICSRRPLKNWYRTCCRVTNKHWLTTTIEQRNGFNESKVIKTIFRQQLFCCPPCLMLSDLSLKFCTVLGVSKGNQICLDIISSANRPQYEFWNISIWLRCAGEDFNLMVADENLIADWSKFYKKWKFSLFQFQMMIFKIWCKILYLPFWI